MPTMSRGLYINHFTWSSNIPVKPVLSPQLGGNWAECPWDLSTNQVNFKGQSSRILSKHFTESIFHKVWLINTVQTIQSLSRPVILNLLSSHLLKKDGPFSQSTYSYPIFYTILEHSAISLNPSMYHLFKTNRNQLQRTVINLRK